MRIIVNFHVVYNCILSFLFKKFRDTQILHYSNVRVKTNLRYFLSDMKQFFSYRHTNDCFYTNSLLRGNESVTT